MQNAEIVSDNEGEYRCKDMTHTLMCEGRRTERASGWKHNTQERGQGGDNELDPKAKVGAPLKKNEVFMPPW